MPDTCWRQSVRWRGKMFDAIDLNHAMEIERLKAKMDIAVKATKDINRALNPAATVDVDKIRDALLDLEMFLMSK